MGLTILLYHSVDDSGSTLSVPSRAFARQMDALRASRRPVLTLSEAAGRLRQGDRLRDAVCITFDDGFRSVAEHAWPALRDRGLPATLFVTHDAMGGRPEWLRQRFAPVFASDDAAALAVLDRWMPPDGIADPRLRRDRLGAFRRAAELPIMSWDEARALARDGLDIGAHTLTHPSLTELDASARAREIADGRHRIAEALGRDVTTFAYPYGDHDAATVAVVAAAGYDAGVTSTAGVNRHPARDRFALRRIGIWPHAGFWRLRYHLSAVRAAADVGRAAAVSMRRMARGEA